MLVKQRLYCVKNFTDRVISRNGNFNWPSRSRDSTPLEFSLGLPYDDDD